MSEKLTPKHSPYTAAELVECGWVARVRSAIIRDNNPVCIGPASTIQAATAEKPNAWHDIMLPNGGYQLIDMTQCALVLDMLEGRTPIPEPKANS